MKSLKKVLSLIFVLAVIIAIFVITELSSSAVTYSNTCGENLIWSLDTSTGVLDISGTGDMKDYSTYVLAPWYSYKSYIKTVNIGDFVTSIGDYAFYNCRSLTGVSIGDSVTNIGYSAFSSCTILTSVVIPNSVISIYGTSFENCTALTSVIIPDSVTSIGDMAFYKCTAITNVTIGDSVTNIGNDAFGYCSSLISVAIGDSVISIAENLFRNCDSLKSVTIPDSVTSIGDYAFGYCDFLASVTIGESVANIGDYAFSCCTSLKSVTLPDSVTNIGDYAFDSCSSLASVTVGESVANIGDYAFSCCTSLKSVTLPDSVTNIGEGAFAYCTSFTNMTVPDFVTSIGYGAFKGCSGLKSLKLPFVGCRKNASSYKHQYPFGYIFGTLSYAGSLATTQYYYSNSTSSTIHTTYYIPSSLKSVTIAGGDILYGAFYNCSSLVNVSIGDSVTSIGDYTFYNCTSITSVDIGDSVTGIGDKAFYNCSSLANVSIGDSVKSIGNYAFCDCTPLTSVIIPDSVTSIGDYAFAYCSYLTSAIIPESVIEIGYAAFNNSPVTITCYENSAAHLYAAKNRISFEFIQNHSFSNYIYNNDATCSSDGTQTAYCDCGCGKTDTIIAEGTRTSHNYVADVIIEANCITDGVVLYICFCGDYYKETIKATAHTFTEYFSNDDATCTANGTKIAKCDNCDVTDTVEDIGSMLEHSFNEWMVVVQPTYNSLGVAERKCSVCSSIEYKIIPETKYTNSFTDVKETHWFYDAVAFVAQKGYMNGMSETKFSPNSNITREQFVLILANIAGVDTNEFKNTASGFEDVKTGQWYSGAVTWAVKEGYVSGMSATKFGRGQSIQRAALARMLYNYASKNGINVDGRADLSAFGDANEFDKPGNSWMVEPIQWAVHNGIISGMTVNGVNCVNPKGTATRAQAARMLMQFDALMSD